MPIYMDRHDVSDFVNAEYVAQLHKEDLKIQDQFNCRGLTYWYDDLKKIAFCLVEAPNKDAIHNMHNHAHGKVPNLIIEVDEKIVESFLGRIEDPEKPSSTDLHIINDPAQRTLMAVRYKTITLNGTRYSQTGENNQHVIRSIGNLLKQFEGRLTKHDDGYLLISFKSAYKAVLCGLELEDHFSETIADLNNLNIHINVGLATGMPVVGNKTFFEDTIKMAHRLCFIDKSNINMTTEVYNLIISENFNESFDKSRIYALPVPEEDYLIALFDFIDNEWHHDTLQVEDFEKPLGMSRTQVYRKVLFLTGKSPNNFLKEYRLNRALSMLNKKMHNISEIAYETGFNSQSYFSKCFQRKFGIMPSEYIKS